MKYSTYAAYGALGLFLLLLGLYSWQSRRGFSEWKRWDNACRSSGRCVRTLWCLVRPLFSLTALLFRAILYCSGAIWGRCYSWLDKHGQRHCPRMWDCLKRCCSHLLGTCWYASATAVVTIDNTIAESERLSRVKQGRSPKILRRVAEGYLQVHKKEGFGAASGWAVPAPADRGFVVNPPEDARSYSSVSGGAAKGSGAARSMLDSEEAWVPSANSANEWLELDLGSEMMVLGIVTQGKRGNQERGTRFSVQFRPDDTRWRNLDGELAAETHGEEHARSLFPTPIVARHLRISVLQWRGGVALRVGALAAEGCFWGSVAVLHTAVKYVDGWQAPFSSLRQLVCEELCCRVGRCVTQDPDLEDESLEFRSRAEVNLGKESNNADQFTRQAIFAGAGRMEALVACVGVAEEIGAKLSTAALKPAGQYLAAAVKQRLQWGLARDGKALQYALICASALQQHYLPEVKAAAKRYKELRGLPGDWDVLGMARENAYGYRMIQKVKLQGCLLGAAPMPGTLAASFQSMLDDTFVSKFTRDRRDGKAVPHRLVLVSATAVQNEQSWLEYARRREDVRKSLKEKPLENGQKFGTAMTPPIVMRTDVAKKLPTLDSEVQEAWLFHGTTAAGAEGITSEDFRISLAGSAAGTLYGRGIYLAEACTKSDEYTQEEQLGTDRYLLLCRATLGRVHYTDKVHNDPNELEDMCHSGRFHAVLGDREKARGTFREFIVYDDDQVYAAYILCYRRQIYNWKESVGGKK